MPCVRGLAALEVMFTYRLFLEFVIKSSIKQSTPSITFYTYFLACLSKYYVTFSLYNILQYNTTITCDYITWNLSTSNYSNSYENSYYYNCNQNEVVVVYYERAPKATLSILNDWYYFKCPSILGIKAEGRSCNLN